MSTCETGVPMGVSKTAIRSSGRETLRSMEPGPVVVPVRRNQDAPKRAINATCARVSTFWSASAGAPTPRSNGRGRLSSSAGGAAVRAS